MVVIVQPVVLSGQLVMNPVNLVDFVLKLQSQTHFLVEWLLCLFKVFHQHIFFILQVYVLLPQDLQFLKNLCVLFLVYLIVVFNNSLSFLNLFPQRLNFPSFITLNFSNHGLKCPFRAEFEQNSVNFPNGFFQMCIFAWQLFEQIVKPNTVDEHRFVNSVDVFRIDSLR